MSFEVQPIGYVEAQRSEARDDDWGGSHAWITLEPEFEAETLDGLESFSHVEVLFLFHDVDPERVERCARHPRNNEAWPRVGIFAQRGRRRPNRLGSTICRVLARDGRRLQVAELDALDGTPVLDLKPVMEEFLPRGEHRQPTWSQELMRDYWREPGELD